MELVKPCAETTMYDRRGLSGDRGRWCAVGCFETAKRPREASLAQLKAAASKVMSENDQIKSRRRKISYPFIGYRTLRDGTKIPVYDYCGRTKKNLEVEDAKRKQLADP